LNAKYWCKQERLELKNGDIRCIHILYLQSEGKKLARSPYANPLEVLAQWNLCGPLVIAMGWAGKPYRFIDLPENEFFRLINEEIIP
jgi:hypothetical protein